MPLPNTALIHPDFSRHHQPSVNGSMRSTVDILLPLADIPPANPFDPDPDGGDAAPDVALADVPARIRALGDDTSIAQAGQTLDTQGYLVQIPAGTFPGLLVGKGNTAHRLRVTVNPEASALEGQVMQILAAPHGTEAWNRDLFCQVHVNQQQGS